MRAFNAAAYSAISSPRVSKIESGTPSLVISRVCIVTGRPCPVVAKSPWKTALINVLLPTPVRPAISTLTCPRSRSASSSAFLASSARLKFSAIGASPAGKGIASRSPYRPMQYLSRTLNGRRRRTTSSLMRRRDRRHLLLRRPFLAERGEYLLDGFTQRAGDGIRTGCPEALVRVGRLVGPAPPADNDPSGGGSSMDAPAQMACP